MTRTRNSLKGGHGSQTDSQAGWFYKQRNVFARNVIKTVQHYGSYFLSVDSICTNWIIILHSQAEAAANKVLKTKGP